MLAQGRRQFDATVARPFSLRPRAWPQSLTCVRINPGRVRLFDLPSFRHRFLCGSDTREIKKLLQIGILRLVKAAAFATEKHVALELSRIVRSQRLSLDLNLLANSLA
jgi:hypothetical protein